MRTAMQHAAQTRSTYTLPLHRVGGGRTARFTVVKRSAAKADAAVQSDLLRQPTTADLEHLHGKEIPVNTYNSKKPFVGKVVEIRDMGGRNKERHVSHIVVDTGGVPFVEGQAFGVIPPGTTLNSRGKEVAHGVRLYSIASSRYGDARDAATCTLCVVRVVYENEAGETVRGLCSNYLCDRKVGDELTMTGPSGTVMLLPDDHLDADIVCISTGTGIAPFRSFWRRLFYEDLPGGRRYGGRFWLLAGFANRDSVLYGDELEAMRAANPERFKLSVALSLEPTNDQKFVQDLIEADADAFFERLMDDGGAADGSGNGGGGNGSGSGSRRGRTQFYLCGLKRMYAGVLERLEALGKARGVDVPARIAQLKAEHRWHVETA